MDWQIFNTVLFLSALFAGLLSLLFYRQIRQARLVAENALGLINNLSEGVYAAEMDGKLKSANRALVRLHGYSSEHEMLTAVNLENAQFYVERGRRAEFQRILLRDGHVQDFVSEIYRQKTRARIWVSESARLITDPKNGKATYYEGSLRDITESIRKRQAETRLNKLADMAPGGLFQLSCDTGGHYAMPFLSQPFKAITGLETFERSNGERPLLPGIEPEDYPAFLHSLTKSKTSLAQWHCVFRYRRQPDAALQWLEIKALPECGDNGAIEWYGCMADITEHKEIVQRIERLAYYDPLTDLPNRRLLMDRLTEATKITQRRRRHGGLLFIDLDGFKAINDTYGHEAGDLYICKISRCLEASLRKSDTVSRLGGDEFVVLLHDLDKDADEAKDEATMVATKIMSNLRRGVELNGVIQSVSCSMGITVFSGVDEIPETLIKNADTAMYQAKAAGRNRFLVYQEPENAGSKWHKGVA